LGETLTQKPLSMALFCDFGFLRLHQASARLFLIS